MRKLLVLFLFTSILSVTIYANITFEERGQIGGTCEAVAVSGNTAYIGMGPRFTVLNVSSPASPTTLSNSLLINQELRCITLEGNYAYVGTGSSSLGIQIIDVSNTSAPTVAGNCITGSSINGIIIASGYAYVASGSYLKILDLINPTQLSVVGSLYMGTTVNSVYVSGSYAYLGCGTSGLKIIDVSTPTAPSLAGTCDTAGKVYDAVVSGSYAYVADDLNGFLVVDVSNPATPSLMGGCDSSGNYRKVCLSGDKAYVAGSRLYIIDISSPSAPVETGYYYNGNVSEDLVLTDTLAYIADATGGLKIIDVSSPSSPSSLGSYTTPLGFASGVAASADWAYVAASSGGMKVIDLSDSDSLSVEGTKSTGNAATGIDVSGNYAYIADNWHGGLYVADVSNPAAPAFSGQSTTDGVAYEVQVFGNYAYLADSTSLGVFDVSNPASPLRVGICSISSVYGLTVSGGYAYVTRSSNGLSIIDITSPSSPVEVGSYSGTYAFDAAVSGSYVYVIPYSGAGVILDVTNPAAPVSIGSLPSLSHVEVYSEYLFGVSSSQEMLYVYDISNPTSPVEVGSISLKAANYVNDIYITENRIFLAGSSLGLYRLSWSDMATTGSLSVSINPAEATGAQWRRAGTATWFNSGDTESDVAPGTYDIEFSDLAGWTKPMGVSASVNAGELTEIIAEYTVESSNWTYWSSTAYGIIQHVDETLTLTSSGPGCGDMVLNEAILTVDLTGMENPTLEFYHTTGLYETADPISSLFYDHAYGDGISVSIDGTEWHLVADGSMLDAGGSQQFSINLTTTGLFLGSSVQIKFQQYDLVCDFYTWPDLGRAFSNIEIVEGGTVPDRYSGGNGSSTDPYQISTVADWQELMATSTDWSQYFILTADLDLDGVTLTPVGNSTTSFMGTFNGNNYVIYNATIDMPTSNYVALFGKNQGQISNVGVENVTITGNWYTGGLIGINSSGTVSQCFTTGSVTGSRYVGGLTGQNYTTVSNCYTTADVLGGTYYIGGLSGSNYGTVTNCYSAGSVTGTATTMGGLFGASGSPNSNACFWNIDTSGQTGSPIGKGLTDEQMKSVTVFQNAGWTGSGWIINDGVDYPRLAWENTVGTDIPSPQAVPLNGSGTDLNPYEIWTTADFALISWHISLLDAEIILMADIDLTGVDIDPIGDLVPFTGTFNGNDHIISNALINRPGNNHIGVFGYTGSGSLIHNLGIQSANMTGNQRVAALAGFHRGTISNCFATGTITGIDDFVGMLAGWSYIGSVNNSYAMGSVFGASNVGGICGYNNYGTIDSCYSTVYVDGEEASTGGIYGAGGGTVTNSVWDTETSQTDNGVGNVDPDPAGAMDKTTLEMMQLVTFTDSGWDFSDADGDAADWMMLRETEDYPRLAWQLEYAGDIAGLYGVDIIDYADLSSQWGQTDCATSNHCDGADIDLSGTVDIGDLIEIADNWLEGK